MRFEEICGPTNNQALTMCVDASHDELLNLSNVLYGLAWQSEVYYIC
jgi:hypothetical protein